MPTSSKTHDITSLLGKTLAYDSAGRLSEATAVPPCPSGLNCAGAQTTLSRFNGWGQRFLRDTPNAQTVFSYGTDGHNLLSETTRNLGTSALSTTDHIWLPTASGPMPVAAVIDGVHYAVHADHLNTPRRLTDASQAVKWQWPYSGFGEIAPQSTPAAGQAPLNYSLRYPGQIDDGNGLFYNWHRFYDPRVGRYTKADPIGLEGGWNRFGYANGSPLTFFDPRGLNSSGIGNDQDERGRDRDTRERPTRPFPPLNDPDGKTPYQTYSECMNLCKDDEFPKCYAAGAFTACLGAVAGPFGALTLGTVGGGMCFIGKQRECRMICSR